MRLSELILKEKESILQDFEEFARTHTSPGASMDIEALRDHAAGMLVEMAHDLEQPQTGAEQETKAKGDAPRKRKAATAAEKHGEDRASNGFSLEEALRAPLPSILWAPTPSLPGPRTKKCCPLP